MEESASQQLVLDLGSHLLKPSRPNKDFLVKSLRQAATALSQIEQPSIPGAADKQEALRNLEAAIKPLKKALIKHGLLKHDDKDVRLLVAICVAEIFRILAPEPPLEDKYLRDVFKLFLRTFKELPDTTSPYFSRRAKILETVSRCKCCVIMLDIDCNDLVQEMFNIFFSIVRDNHQRSLIGDILSIMIDIINEEATPMLVDIILRNLVLDGKDTASAARSLAASLIESCSDKLEPFVCGFLTSCFVDKEAIDNELKELYHEVIFKIFQSAPLMLLAIIPNLTQELLTDQVDVRMKALNLTGRLFVLPKHGVAEMYRDLFVEFLNRFSDKSAEVRMGALKCGKDCYMANPSGKEASDILAAVEGRLLDFDDRVRIQALIVACDLVKFNLKYVPPKLISEASERLRDKKVSVRKKALQKLIEVYRDYCNKCSEGYMTVIDHVEQIPCKILQLCCDKDCKEFRSQNLELVLSEDLFPSLLPVEERMRHWIHLFSLFNPLHMKALNSILSQKRRLQTEMRLCLGLWSKEKAHDSEDMQKRLKSSILKMSASFADPSKAEECFHKLNQMKDSKICDALLEILDEPTYVNSQTIRDKFLKMIGDKHPHYEFLRLLSSKCSSNIFSSEHVQYALNLLSGESSGNMQLKASSIKLLLAVVTVFPSYLRGSEEQFKELLEDNESTANELIEVLSKAAPYISVNVSDFYPLLERICLEGSRAQAKYAVSSLASLVGSSEQFIFSELCEVLLDSLQCGRNIPTVLQSFACIGQYAVSAFEAVYGEIRSHIEEKIFKAEPLDDQDPLYKSSGCCSSCKLKIYGLKTLVKSFLPHHGHKVTRKIDDLLKFLEKMLKNGDATDGILSCKSDTAHIRLAAAKAVLQLSRKWDFHISPEIFRLTIMMAKDSDAFIRRSFLDKVHKLLKERTVQNRYACAFSFAICDCLKDLRDNSFKYMKEFVKDSSREARIRQTSLEQVESVMHYPAYIVVFLVHVLAHDSCFPSKDCNNEHAYAEFCYPLFSVLQMLVSFSIVDGDMDLANNSAIYLLCIFRAIKRAEDAVDARKSPKLHILADIGISSVNVLNRNGVMSSRPPGQILLPSALYRISLAKTSNNETNLMSYAPEQSFVEKVVRILESQISLPVSSLSKHGQKGQEDGALVVVKDNILPLISRKRVDISISGAAEVDKKNLRGSRKRALSPTAAGSLALPKKCANATGRKNSSSRTSETTTAREQVSSCSSLIVRTSVETEVSNQSFGRKDPCLKEKVGVNDSKNLGSVENPRVKSGDSSILKDISNQSEVIVGQRIKLFSPVDGCFYSGTIEGFNCDNNAHKITYDNGDVELVCLDSESWEILSEESLVEKDTLGEDPETSKSQNCSVEGNVDACEEAAVGSRKLRSRMVPLAAKAKKGRKVSGGTSVSEVVNEGRRTRRQKVS